MDYFRDISSIYGAWVGIVIGYFFGSRKVETLTEKIDSMFEEMDFTTKEIDEDYHELQETKNNIEDLYTKAKQELQYIVAKSPNLDKDLLERLKSEHDIIV